MFSAVVFVFSSPKMSICARKVQATFLLENSCVLTYWAHPNYSQMCCTPVQHAHVREKCQVWLKQNKLLEKKIKKGEYEELI